MARESTAFGNNSPKTLNDDQYSSIYWLGKIVRENSWILIADDLQWWDGKSVELLRALFSGRFRQSFPFFSRVRVIAVVTKDVESLQESTQRFIRDINLPVLHLAGPDRLSLFSALELFGVNDVNDELIDVVQATTGGHLQLVKEVGKYLSQSTEAIRRSFVNGTTSSQDLSWIRDLFDARLDKTQADNVTFTQLLESAAAIGVLFSEDELRCLAGLHEETFSKLLNCAAEHSILSREGTIIRFRHGILQLILRSPTPARDQALHRQFGQCLQKLNPGDYQTRAIHCRMGGQNDEADVFAILAETKRIREGLSSSIDTVGPMSPRDGKWPLGRVGECLVGAADNSLRQKHTEAYQLLEELSCDMPLLLGAERAYLMADCRLKSVEVSDRQFSIDLLSDWRSRVQDEFEIWLRFSLTLMAALALNEEVGAALEIERQIGSAIDQRQRYDPDCSLYRGDVYRRSDAMYGPEIAARRLADAAAIFKGSGSVPRRPVAFLRAMTNLIGTRVVLGEYSMALESASEIATLLRLFPSMLLPRPTTAMNNITLARALEEPVDHAMVIESFAQTLSECDRPEDIVLIRNNYVACLARAGRLDEANAQMAACLRELQRMYRVDAYYKYFVESNSFAIDLVSQSIPDPVQRWDSLQLVISQLAPQVRLFLYRRHQLLREALVTSAQWDADEWDTVLQRQYPRELGRAWTFYGRGFLFTDLQHWSDG